jgi:hypothetical protein
MIKDAVTSERTIWGERTHLLPKVLTYVFSLDVDFHVPSAGDGSGAVAVPQHLRVPVPLRVQECAEREWSTYHLLGERFVAGPTGAMHEVPKARVIRGTTQVLIVRDGSVPLEGTWLFETDTTALLAAEYSGVLSLPGGTEPSHRHTNEVIGDAFVCVRSEVSIPKYRWMVVNQLIGVGKVAAYLDAEKNDRWSQLRCTFDFHIGM